MAPGGDGTGNQHSKAAREHLGCWGSSSSHSHSKKEPEIVTILPPGTQTCHTATIAPGMTQHQLVAASQDCKTKTNKTSIKKGPSTSWGDKLLKKRPGKGGSTILWLPGSGRHVSEGYSSYKPFTHIVRTLHVDDAIDVCNTCRIEPKNVITFSSIDSRELSPSHPCANIKVLWFSTSSGDQDDNAPDWYGNVEFAVDAKILLQQWKYFYLVEMMTTPTHTTSRILVTNSDYSDVLTEYNPNCVGGPWQVTADGQFALSKCSRFKFKGTNIHEHVLEFMLEVSRRDEKKIIKECQISFKNHEEAKDMKVRHVCNRYQRAGLPCPTPFSCLVAAFYFFLKMQQIDTSWSNGRPKLSKSAQQYLQLFLEDQKKQVTTKFTAISVSNGQVQISS
ncbi:hypothetical protein OTU49_000286 [Cherax quadricarinatus]|uniref:Uncharacterized protein n=2 Tax=Cherax quadricarinatus TaxID=27406 RepID=A0AAW0Y9L5_CHEQU